MLKLLAGALLLFMGSASAQTPEQQLPEAANDVRTPGEPNGGHIELDDLIKHYMVPTDVSRELPSGASLLRDWSIGSAPGTPISWEHAGIKECDAYRKKEFGAWYCRTGSVILTVRGKPTHSVLGKIVEPGRWKVMLMGARGGFTHVSIDCGCLSQELDAPLGETAGQADGLKVTSLRSCGSGSGGGSELLRVTSSGKEPAFVRETWSCGASGLCSKWFVFTSDEKDAEKLIASECAQDSGSDAVQRRESLGTAKEVRDECLSEFTKFNVCEKAREAQRAFALLLPMKVNANLTLSTVFAAGPRVVVSAIWHVSKADMDASLLAGNMSLADLEARMSQATRNSICSNDVMAAFIGLGGQVQYIYKTEDQFVALSPIVTACGGP